MRTLCLFALPFCGAIFLREYLPAGLLIPILIAACLGLLLPTLRLRRGRRFCAALLLSGLVLGALYGQVCNAVFFQPAQALADREVTMEATVLDYPETTDYGVKVPVRMETDQGKIKVLLYADSEFGSLTPGDRLSGPVQLSDATERKGETIRYHSAEGIFLLAYQENILTVENRPTPISLLPRVFAHILSENIERDFPSSTAAFFQALVVGDRSGLTEDLETGMIRSGVYHIIAISGMHVSFLAAVIAQLAGNRRRAALIGIPLILLFMAVTGNSPSVIRAGILQILILVAPLLGRERDGPTALSFALLLLLLQNPRAAGSVGLQLSFAAVAGMMLFSDRLYHLFCSRLPGGKAEEGKREKTRHPVLRFIFSSLSVTLGATVFTTPLLVLYFDRISLIAPLANLLCLWAVSYLFILGLAVALLGLILPVAASAAALVLSAPALYVIKLSDLLSWIPYASVSTGAPLMKLWVALVYACLLLCIPPGRRLRKLLGTMGGCTAALILVLALSSLSVQDARMEIRMLDVGQGQSILARSAGESLLIDCGGGNLEDPGALAAAYLENTGRLELDYLVLTHFHSDHAYGVPSLFSHLKVDTLVVPALGEDPETEPLRERILGIAREKGTEIVVLEERQQLDFGQGTVTLFPPVSSGDSNEEGLSLLLTAGDFDLLVTGDMDRMSELRLLGYYALPDLEVLVVGHHGSADATSEWLLDAATPETALISVGPNSYGHPHEETLQRLAERDITVYRTDRMGDLTIKVR